MSATNPGQPVGFANQVHSCSECGSREVRPSRSKYPKDKERIGESVGSFWRCAVCGSRFLGPFVPDTFTNDKPEARRRRAGYDSLDRRIRLSRRLRGSIFSILVILVTIVLVAVVLRSRDESSKTFILPR